ncbi:glycosyltransferase [Actinomycetospora sp. CA-084318]|uniref:glycosyltransferase n=1 Tax=Actinomycetospora sp. CA-084318 TaxID=3239892 RepID=UPI003D97EC73
MTVLGVVVPVHDEEALLGGCLEALDRAARWVRGSASVRLVVVLDSCRDASRDITREHGVETVAVAARNVGVARDAGFRALLDGPGAVPDWIATTDADSRVPPDWLLAQLAAYERGADARVGAVYVDDWDGHGRSTREWFRTVYDAAADPHPHVHGANLGVRREAYDRCGGFQGLAVGEDVTLVAALDADGRVHRSRRSPVLTSGRRIARADGGFAARLGELEAG